MKFCNKKNKKNLLKKIGYGVAGVGALGLATLGVSKGVSYIKADTKELNLSYEVGALDSQGEYVEDESRIYTKEKFACEGLKATLEFDSTINYQIFYYDILDNFIEKSEIIDKGYSDSVPLNGAYARVVITPINDEDDSISFIEKYKYGNQLNISTSKDAGKNMNEKFKVVNGKIMSVYNSLSDVKFITGYYYDIGDFSFKYNNDWICTYSQLLKVKKGYSLSCDLEKLENLYSCNDFILNVIYFNNDCEYVYHYEGDKFEIPDDGYVIVELYYTNDSTINIDLDNLYLNFTYEKTII